MQRAHSALDCHVEELISSRKAKLPINKFFSARVNPVTLFEAGEAFAAGVAGVEVVPEFDVVFVLFPAEENFFAANKGGEVDKAAIDVFDLDFAGLEFEEEFFDVGHGLDPDVDDFAADVGAGSHECANAFFLFLEVLAVVSQGGEPSSDLRQESAGFFEGVMLVELVGHGPDCGV